MGIIKTEVICKKMTMNKKELDTRVQRAVDNFMEGYGCCQSVVAAFADLYGVSDELAKRIGAGFGGGVGRMRMMCGAVSGIVTLVGLDCGQTEGDDREGQVGLLQSSAGVARQVERAEWLPHLCRDSWFERL